MSRVQTLAVSEEGVHNQYYQQLYYHCDHWFADKGKLGTHQAEEAVCGLCGSLSGRGQKQSKMGFAHGERGSKGRYDQNTLHTIQADDCGLLLHCVCILFQLNIDHKVHREEDHS
jgi:hypothetical protein